MRIVYIIFGMLWIAFSAQAQEVRKDSLLAETNAKELTAEYIEEDTVYLNGMVPMADFPAEAMQKPDSLHLPTLDYSGKVPSRRWWYYPTIGGYWGWNLHEGLNMSLDLSAFTSFGKNRFSGTSERISAMYAKAVNDKLSFAVGGYFTNMNSGIGNFRDAGLSAIIDYRFNDHWEAYIYAQKSLASNASGFRHGRYYPFYAFDMFANRGDRIGAGLRYNFNESTWIELQVDFSEYQNPFQYRKNFGMMPSQSDMPK